MKNLYKKIAIEAAMESGLFIGSSVGKRVSVFYKGMGNIVTDVDRKSQDIIIRKLTRNFPSHSILSEEQEPVERGTEYRWIIDPLDGTTNFAHAFPFFCVSIALEYRKKIVLGVVYDPIRRELFCAETCKGAYLNGGRIRVSRTRKLAESFLATGFSYDLNQRKKNVRYFRDFLAKVCAIRRAGSASLDLCYVACGRFDGFWEMDLHPWDTAAAYLIVKEAGGQVTRFNNSPFVPYDRTILATNGHIHKSMVNILR